MPRSYLTEILRTIRRTKYRFLSIVTIVALGVAFFTGIRATSPDMKATADKYYSDQKYMDIKVVSTMGLDEDDIKALKDEPEVRRADAGYSVDMLVYEGDDSYVTRVMSCDFSDSDAINQPALIEGRFPETDNEIVMDYDFFQSSLKIGDQVTFVPDSNSAPEEQDFPLKRETYNIVGLVRSPLFISFEKGSSSIGNGMVNAFFIVNQAEFNMDVFTEAYLLINNLDGISRFDAAYKDKTGEVKGSLELLADKQSSNRTKNIKAEPQEEIDDAKRELETGKRELEDAKQKLLDAEKEFEDGEKEYLQNLNNFNEEISKAQEELNKSQRELDDARRQLQPQRDEYNAGLRRYNAAQSQLESKKAQLNEGIRALNGLSQQIQTLEQNLLSMPAGAQEYLTLQAQIESLKAQRDEQSAAIASARAEINSAETQLSQTYSTISKSGEQLKAAENKILQSAGLLSQGNKELAEKKADGEARLKEARTKLDESKAEIEDGWKEYNDKLPDIKKAEAEIEDAQKELNDIEDPEWYILDASQNISFADYEQNCDRINALGNVFPLIFFLVAALVSMTTMTRMVENERRQIGVFKALGYSKGAISFKYIVYAFTASVLGSVIGFAGGFTIFPSIIATAYGMLYNLPKVTIAFLSDIAFQAGVFAVACVIGPTIAVGVSTLREAPATLMLPKAPKPGKRIWLEKLEFIWKRLNFTQKVTMRNLFRYKKRFLMTVIGITGCAALLLTGFGIYDSISVIADRQFEGIAIYDMSANIIDKASEEEIGALMSAPELNGNIDSFIMARQQAVDLIYGDVSRSATMVATNYSSEFNNFVSLKNYKTKEAIPLSDEGVIISQKAARLLGAQTGDEITVRDSDNKQFNAKIVDISENYAFHYIYVTDGFYESFTKTEYRPNNLLLNVKDDSQEIEYNISEILLKDSLVSSVSLNRAVRESFRDMINALVYVVVVLIISAAALAFVVMFSLSSINIDERQRELATLKVLGFKPKEVSAYVFRENIFLTFMGVIAGLISGTLLHRYVIDTIEVDLVMFSRQILPFSYVISFVLTILFSGAVNLIMRNKLRKINMVDSLKSVD